MRNKLLAGAGATVIGLTSMAGLGVASAATSTTSGQTSLVQKIAQKFNISETDVQKVFDEDRTEHMVEMQAKDKERLAQAVTDGKITQAMADLITAKQAEMRTFMDGLRDKTDDERKAAMDTKRDELKQWATDNNIPEEYIHGFGGGHGTRGPGEKPADSTN